MTPHEHSTDFIADMARWGWPDYFRGLGREDLLVMDAGSLDAFRNRYGALACQTAAPDTAEAAASRTTGAILLLCKQGERKLARRMRLALPGRQVLACSYDLAGLSGGGMTLPRPADITVGLPAPTVFKTPPILIVSSPYSDAEHLLDHLARNRMVFAGELLDPTLLSLALSRDDFDLRRFMMHLFARHGADGQLAMHVQTDVLLALVDAGLLRLEDLADWLTDTEARLLYFTRRDKVVQCLVATALAPHGHRSAWAMDQAARNRLPRETAPTAAVVQQLHEVIQDESRIEAFLEKELDVFRSYTLEELVESPVRVLKSIEIFLSRKLPEATQIPDYGAAYQGLAGIADSAPDIRAAYLDRLGLSRNAAGSLVSLTDILFDRLARKT